MNYCFNTYPGAELWKTARDRGSEVVLAKMLKREKGGGEKQRERNRKESTTGVCVSRHLCSV